MADAQGCPDGNSVSSQSYPALVLWRWRCRWRNALRSGDEAARTEASPFSSGG